MQVVSRTPTTKNPPEHFTGDVWLIHARGQTLHVMHGIAWVASRHGDKVELHAGQTVYRPPGEEHRHGAAQDSFMEHLALLDNADDPATTTTWLEHVTDKGLPRLMSTPDPAGRRR